MAELKAGDIVEYVGEESTEYQGYVGISIKPWSDRDYPKAPAWVVDWFFLPKNRSIDRIWFFESNLRKLGEVQHG